MKNRYRNNQSVQINAPDAYCLSRDWVVLLFNASVLTSVLTPPNVTVIFNNTIRQNNFDSLGSSTASVPARPFWIVVGFCCYIWLCLIGNSQDVPKRVSRLNLNDYTTIFLI